MNRDCAICKAPIPEERLKRRGNHRLKFCSYLCQLEGRRQRGMEQRRAKQKSPRDCEMCGTLLISDDLMRDRKASRRGRPRSYCSERCARASRNLSAREKYHAMKGTPDVG